MNKLNDCSVVLKEYYWYRSCLNIKIIQLCVEVSDPFLLMKEYQRQIITTSDHVINTEELLCSTALDWTGVKRIKYNIIKQNKLHLNTIK